MKRDPEILLATINAKWIHPSLALRLLKANLGHLEEHCEIIEFALRQPLREKLDPILGARPRILGISVSIWNHSATLELLRELWKAWGTRPGLAEYLDRSQVVGPGRPVIVLGGPEVSHLPPETEIFRYADFCIRGEGELAFKTFCERILGGWDRQNLGMEPQKMRQETNSPPGADFFVNAAPVDLAAIKSAYHLYTDEDVSKKLIYVEASRGCPFNCEFCLSSVKPENAAGDNALQGDSAVPLGVREFPLEPFLSGMDDLIRRGVRTFKFLDRTFNLNINRARRIMEFFLERIEERKLSGAAPLTVHFEMVPSRFPLELRETLTCFPPDAIGSDSSLRLEIGIQTLNPKVSARIGRPSDPEKELETLRFLREKTNAIIHADLIAGLPGEDLASFGRGFDRLWAALSPEPAATAAIAPAADATTTAAQATQRHPRTEIQLGILKLLPGAPINRHTEAFGMRYNPAPPYEVLETAAMSAAVLERVKNFARFWGLIMNSGLLENLEFETKFAESGVSTFERFMALSDSLLARFGRNWGIDKHELLYAILSPCKTIPLS
ncbi:hypothetical protein AGMMS50293_01770 [Spirochaetia bacterium]|nr:hypothetical protein AGMMS50293_01770 [Spirochaetia bacterium]